MDNKIKFVIMTLIGFIIGLMIEVFMFSFAVDYSTIDNRWIVLAHFLVSGLFGAVCFGGTIVYDLEKWSLVKSTIVHFLMVFISFIIINEIMGWFPHNILLITLALMIVMYFIIWLIMYMNWKREVKKMNEELEALNSKLEEGE